jgi:uncharacterized protein
MYSKRTAMNAHQAILIFSRTPSEEARLKPLSSYRLQSMKLSALLLDRLRETVQKTHFPVFYISEKQQKGATFGERLSNAFTDVFKKGFTQVVAIGNDCPSLEPRHIKAAFSALAHNNTVLGPCTDGGIYLMGLRKSEFLKINFQEINWQKHTVCTELKMASKASCIILELLADIDSFANLKAQIPFLHPILARKLRLVLVEKFSPKYHSSAPIQALFQHRCLSLRAPPLAA